MKDQARLPKARKKDLVICELDHETLVYDLGNDKAHCLNETVALVWKCCDGKTTVTRMARALRKKLCPPVDTDIVWLAIDQLQRFDLLEECEQPRVAPFLSRRELVLKYAPAALALPVIMSITVPTPAGAVSCVPNGGQCSSGPQCCSGCCPSTTCQPAPSCNLERARPG